MKVEPSPEAGPSGTAPASRLSCAGCGAPLPEAPPDGYPFRCPQAAAHPEMDHVVARAIRRDALAIEPEGHPFLRYRRFLHSYHLAMARGLGDAGFAEIVGRLDARIAAVDGRGFRLTPLRRSPALEARIGMAPQGRAWIKDETGQVSGSHKARHLMGLMLYLEVVRVLGLDDPRRRRLAIASCGNAALAAAVVARAADYPLDVFVPPDAPPPVLARIADLGAGVTVCPRTPGVAGDPAYRRFRSAVAAGALPFCCQGPDNGLAIEGGATLWLEVAEALGGTPPHRVFVQVGGGALASACVQAFREIPLPRRHHRLPQVHAVQTRGAYPLKRAYDRLVERFGPIADRAAAADAMRHARRHRTEYMWPWEAEPHSVAHGILDDETYDWAAVLHGMLQSGGHPVVVDDGELRRANGLARETTHVHVDCTGSAGLAGLVQALGRDAARARETVVVLFSGAARG